MASPLFMLAGYLLDLNIRISGFLSDSAQVLYYFGLFACAAVCHFKPKMISFVAMAESGFNVSLLIIGTYTSFALPVDGQIAPEQFNVNTLFAFLFSGAVLVMVFQNAVVDLSKNSDSPYLKDINEKKLFDTDK